ncbi:hypothetical protein G5C51_04065 [Streptomyces sp. A7024]|uniref:Copper resistance protein D domain-containing protein n=1 Tax=Streptomyces coryli TaxID=1128680 RepID=A0A6G4TTH6_9ACTN|nr:CopD family protein [Streptomyces coryli]NGN63082.1 hypothetical protein [Streptomyces coryli]
MHEISGLLAAAPGVTAVYAMLRWTALAGLVVVTGAAVCACVCRPDGPSAVALRRVLGAGLAAGWAAGLVLLLLPGPLSPAGVRTRAGLLLALGAAWLLARRALAAPDARLARRIATTAGAAATAVLAAGIWYIGELPVGAPFILPLAAAETAQLAATAVWLGGTVALAAMLIAERDAAQALTAARRFAPAGVVCLHLLMATVNMEAWQSIGKAPTLLATGYGQLLLAQIGALTLLLALDALARACASRDTAAAPSVTKPAHRVVLHRTLAAQLAVGAALFLIAGPIPLITADLPIPPQG